MLIIAEKPELARAIFDALGGGSKKEGYYFCGGDIITWCFGHMLQLYNPEDYDPALAKWSLAHLPMAFSPVRKKPVARSKEQLLVIARLLKEAKIVVNAGDPDPEGQLLVDEILRHYDYKGQVKRVLINDNNPALIRKAFANLRDNAEFAGLSAAAEARQIADQLFGFNMTRLYTLAARKEGFSGVLSVGRVQTPILGLVVRRDREHADHKPVHYHTIKGDFAFGETRVTAAYQVKADDPQDEKGRLNDADRAAAIAQSLSGRPVRVESVVTERRETPPPLPYNLLKLQADAARLHGMTPDKVKDITQALREKYRLITYNRSDSQYLSDEQHADAAAVLEAVGAVVPNLLLGHAPDPARKSRAFDSSKVTAHHAVIPTCATAAGKALAGDEAKIYALIARAYVAQFMPDCVHESTRITLAVGDAVFVHSGRKEIAPGWKALYGSDLEPDDGEEGDDSGIATFAEGDAGECLSCRAEQAATSPKPLYSTATLLEDLTRVAHYARDDRIRALLLEKDKGKAGEHGGIGTPATRDAILKTLMDRGYLELSGKGKAQKIVSTQAGRDIYDALPDVVKHPDMTALWHEQQLGIERGEMTVEAFLGELNRHIAEEVAKVTEKGLELAVEKHPCPECGRPMLRRKGVKNHFWGCSAFPECRVILPDEDGRPGVAALQIVPGDSGVVCPDCGKPMRLRKNATRPFYGCTGFPHCKKILSAVDGKPVYDHERPITSELHKCSACGQGLKRRPGKNGTYFWGCSAFPQCRRVYPDLDGKPDYDAAAKAAERRKTA